MIVLIRSWHSSSYGFVALPCDVTAQHNPDNLQCVHEPLYLLTKRRIFSAQSTGALSTTILGNGGPASSLSAVTLFVNFNSGATIYHGFPHKPSKFVDSQASLSVCLLQLLPRTTPFLVMNKTAPVLPCMTTNKDSLSHATCK